LDFNEQFDFSIKISGSPSEGDSLILYFNDYKQTINLVTEEEQETAEEHEPQTYYVSKDGNNNNNGFSESPWLTISKAAEIALAGDTVYIKAGTYNETITPKNSGVDGKIITFTNYDDDEVIIQGQEAYGFYLGYGINYIKIDGLTITRGIGAGAITNYPKSSSSTAHGAGIKISASNYHIISNNTLYDNDIGVFISMGAPFGEDGEKIPSANNQVSDNIIYNSGEAGIRIKRSNYTTVDGNKIYHNGYPENPVYNEPAAGVTYYCTIGTTISNNTIYDNSASAIYNYAGTNSDTCDSESTVIKNNILSQTNPMPIEDKFFTGEKIVLIIADIEIEDPTHLYQYNTFYNSEPGSPIVVWGLSNFGEDGELLTFSEYLEKAQALNPNSGIGDQEIDYNPIE
jgi:parallel beta-helix repeat protein